jgi:hypothetical protein
MTRDPQLALVLGGLVFLGILYFVKVAVIDRLGR